MSSQSTPHPIEIEHPRCPYCKDRVQPGDSKSACNGCMSWHHADCWTEHGRCSSCQGTAVAREGAEPAFPAAALAVGMVGGPVPVAPGSEIVDQPLDAPVPEYSTNGTAVLVSIVLGAASILIPMLAFYVTGGI